MNLKIKTLYLIHRYNSGSPGLTASRNRTYKTYQCPAMLAKTDLYLLRWYGSFGLQVVSGLNCEEGW